MERIGRGSVVDVIEAVVDHCIRRGLGFVGLAIGMVMLSLSYDFALALRIGADLLAVTAVVLLWGAWRAPVATIGAARRGPSSPPSARTSRTACRARKRSA
jgi:hypothetical protein